MTHSGEPSYLDLVYEVLRGAEQPLSFAEICQAVERRRPAGTRDPKATIRGALGTGTQLISLGDGRYGYLPHLLRGSVVRLPLSGNETNGQPLTYPVEARQALWPSFFENSKRQLRRPVQARLSGRPDAALALEHLAGSTWGSPVAEPLHSYLAEGRASEGDALLIRVLDADAGQVEAWLERRTERDGAAVKARNRALADAVRGFLLGRQRRTRDDAAIWDLAIALLARGFYRAEPAPDPLEAVLSADARFTYSGSSSWMLAEDVPAQVQAAIHERRRLEGELAAIIGATQDDETVAAGRDQSTPGERVLLTPAQLAAAMVELPSGPRPGTGEETVPTSRRSRNRAGASGSTGARKAPRGAGLVYQLKVTLRDLRPPVWRRLLVPANTRLSELHDILQVAMGWTDSHLHQFEVGRRVIGVPDPEDWREVENERRVRLADVAPRAQARLRYEYDFGDSWQHDIMVEKVLPATPDDQLPACTGGRRACPPEDVGGVWGYAEFLEAISDPAHPEHDEMLEWGGEDFDPEAFDADAITAALRRW